jgi:hypothetical protein
MITNEGIAQSLKMDGWVQKRISLRLIFAPIIGYMLKM